MARPDHLFTGESTPDLYDTRDPQWSTKPPLRRNFMQTHKRITSVADIKATLRAGEYAWPGGYPMYILLNDGSTLHFDCVRENWREMVTSYQRFGEFVCSGADINYEDGDLMCCQCNKRIQSAYAEDGETSDE